MNNQSRDPFQVAYEPITPRKRPLWYKVLAVVSAVALIVLSGRALIFLVASYL